MPEQNEPEDNMRPVGQSARSQLLQKATTLVVKAGLSSIPWAALVFDLGQAGVDFGNARITERFLKELSERVGKIEGTRSNGSSSDGTYEVAAHIAIRRLLTETNPRMADALARAVASLERSGLEKVQQMEIARALEILNEPALHLLQTYYRFHNDELTYDEHFGADQIVSGGEQLGTLIVSSMNLLQWNATFSTLQTSGLIEGGIDGGDDDAVNYMSPQPLTLLGIKIVELCFEDPSVPMFGKYAAPLSEDEKSNIRE